MCSCIFIKLFPNKEKLQKIKEQALSAINADNSDLEQIRIQYLGKKGELTSAETEAIKKHSCAWGCDICQEVCPFTLHAKRTGSIYTDIDFFKEELIPVLTSKKLSNISDEEFSHRAYSWRGRNTIARNLEIIENNTKNKEK